MSIAAALPIAPTGQPATGQPNASSSAHGDAFAALLDAATSADASGAATNAVPATQSFPTQSPLLHLQLGVEGAILGPALPAGTDALAVPAVTGADTTTGKTPEAAVAGPALATAQPATAISAAVPVVAANAPVEQAAAETPAPVIVESTADAAASTVSPASTPATTMMAATTSAATVKAAQPAETSGSSTSDNETEADSEGAATPSSAQATTPAASGVSAIAVVATPAAQAGAEAVTAVPAAPETPLEPIAPADAASAETAEPAGADGGAAPAGSNRAAAQPTTVAQASATTPVGEAPLAKPDAAALATVQAAQPTDATGTTAQPAEAARSSTNSQALQSAPAATVQVYSRIIERADGRSQRFEIRLDPAELGRVDVRIEIGADRKVHAVLAAHDSAALSDLMRGQRALERALTDAGIDLADKGVRFELAGDNGAASQQRDSESGNRGAQANVWRRFESMTVPVADETAAAASQPSWRPQRLDLVA